MGAESTVLPRGGAVEGEYFDTMEKVVENGETLWRIAYLRDPETKLRLDDGTYR